MKILIVFLFAVAYCYPIVVTNTDLSPSDLFINQIDLMSKIRQQENKKVILINIQTSHQDNEIFQSKLLKRIESLKNFKKLLKSKSTFVSPFVDYSSIQFAQGLQKDNQALLKQAIIIFVQIITELYYSIKLKGAFIFQNHIYQLGMYRLQKAIIQIVILF
ncbi:unnamed protein product [Paramecium primaurelia]|uniref:Transmembrane protein n=1 Tax=Paramecium primaurelia TaxID=5886 RepID=A0A8S1ME43_PARPR|nr:unnamed protein product [Paramecium primaurelia]